VVFVLAYPAVQMSDVIPFADVEAFFEAQFGDERAHSLMFRFENEALTLDRAMERPWFGWGSYCRACLFEPWSGAMTSVRDGAWIIQLGDLGIVGFIGKFGLLLFPLLTLVRRLRYVPRASDRRLLAGLGLMIGFATFDLIPNGDFTRSAFVLSGALFGCLTGILREAAGMREKRRFARVAAAKEARTTPRHP
jgi:hypothetical protein